MACLFTVMLVMVEPDEVEGPLHLWKKDDSKAICVVRVYFLGLSASAQALASTVISKPP